VLGTTGCGRFEGTTKTYSVSRSIRAPALAATQPANFTYSTLQLADGTFIHNADVSKGDNPLNGLPTFAAFVDGIGERCEPGHGPDPQQATLIGSYAAPRD